MNDTPSTSTSTLQTAGSVLGLAGYVYVLGGIVSWVRLSAARLPADLTSSLLDPRVLLSIGLRALLFAAIVFGVVCVVAHGIGARHYNEHKDRWKDVAGVTSETPAAQRRVRTIAGLNILVLVLVLGLGGASLLRDLLPGWLIPSIYVLVLLVGSAFLVRVGPLLFFGRRRLYIASALGVGAALFCETPIAILLLTSVAIAALSPLLVNAPAPASFAAFVRSPLPWALAGIYTLVAVAFVATPPITYPRAVFATANKQQVGGYIARTTDGLYLATCTPQPNGTSSDERVALISKPDTGSLTIGGTPYRLDSGDRSSPLTLVLGVFGVDAHPPVLHIELRHAQPTCDATERASAGPDLGLGAGVVTGHPPPRGRAVGNEAPISATSPRGLARLARMYQPTLEVTIADRFWPVSLSSALEEQGVSRPKHVCLVIADRCGRRPPTLADLSTTGSGDDYLDFPAKLGGDPTQQFLAFTRGQGIDDTDASNWLSNPNVLDPWQSAQIYFYYGGSAGHTYPNIRARLVALQYWFFYPYNYYPTAVRRGLMPAQPLAGDRQNTDLHEGDWEHVVVLVDASPPHRPRYLYLARHDKEGQSLPWNSPRLSFDGVHPIVQAGFGGHPSYDNHCSERPRKLLHNQSSDWVICGSGRYGFLARTTPLVDLARASWPCWPGHFGEAKATERAKAKLPESSPQRWDHKLVHVAGPRSPLRQAENRQVCRRGPLVPESSNPIR